jgi:hypothetical protein
MKIFALAALTLLYPHAWHVTTQAQTAVTDPVQRFALYSGPPLPRRGSPRANQVVAILMEQEPPAGTPFRPRPAHLRLPQLGTMENFVGDRWGEIVFRDRRRDFYLFVWVGRSATGHVHALLAALDSLHVS